MTLTAIGGGPLPAGSGGKAVNLGWLKAHGFHVPAAWVIPAGEDTGSLAAALEAAIDLDALYAVRSSADVEDGASRTFAGQFRSVLDVRGVEAIVAAVADVRASAAEPSVVAYAGEAGIDPSAIAMGVVVQRMVEPVTSGIAFSRNPLSGLDEVVIEAVPGRGDALAQDGVTPDRWIHRWGDITERPAAPRTDPVLIDRVARETRRIAAVFGRPVDVEWVHDGTDVHWVQVRPITGLEGIGVYSNRIAREVLPGIIKPLVWSVNVPVVNRAWVDLFTEAIGANDIDPSRLARAFGYRAYFNMGAIGDIFVALGMPRESLELLLGLPAGSEKPRFKPTRATYRHTPRMLQLAWRLNRYDRRLERQLPVLEARYRTLAATDPATLDEAALVARVDELMALTRRMAYANIVAPLLMNAYGSLVRRRSETLGIDGATVDPAKGMEGIHDYDPRHAIEALAAHARELPDDRRSALESGGCATLAADPALVELRGEFDAFLARFGHLGDSGNDFSSPRWGEQPETVLRMVLHAEAGPDRAALGWEDVRGRTRGPARLLLGRLFRRAATFRRLRESVSFQYTYGYGLFRETFLALADRLVARGILEAKDGIFYLELDEIRAAVRDGGDEPGRIVAARRADIAAAADLDLPEVILGDDFVPRHRPEAGSVTLRGVPTSRGTYRGPLRVIRSTDEFNRIQRGDVLVVPFSDVAWTPLFARAGAVVAESGGMLSHSSIVAREHGIPCVVSVAGALALRDGEFVHVDGYSGIITVEGAGDTVTVEGAGDTVAGDPGASPAGTGD